ncbi:MAG: hypothetical protein ACI9G1_003524 [Pirellulaceae bacterium]|jgi:uncharacterized protein YkwD
MSRILIAALLVMTTASHLAAADELADDELADDERKELFGLVDKFRRARNDLDARAKIVPEALKFGETGASILQKYLARELQPLVVSYSKALDSAARGVFAKQVKSIDLERVMALREEFFEISHKLELSKSDLKRAEPIFRSLEAMVVSISASELFAVSPSLNSRRDRIEAVAEMLRQCENEIPDVDTLPSDLEQWLEDVEKHAIGNARPMSPSDRQVAQKNNQLSNSLDSEEVRVVNDLNYMRMILGMNSLIIEPKLAACARDHSKDMEKLKFFSHTSPVTGKATPWDRAKAFKVEARSENIYMGSTQGQAAHWGWFFSPGHHVNMLAADRKAIGVGRSGKYFTQMFQ